MKLISVVHYPEYGGPHNQLLRLHAPLAKRGVEMLTILPEGPGADRLRHGGLRIETRPLGRVRAVRDVRTQAAMATRFPLDLVALASIFHRERPDVVQLSSLMNPHAAYVAKAMGIPVVWQIVDTRPPLRVRRAMMYQIRRLADVIMPIGAQVAQAHPGADAFGERSVTFFPPVDLEEFGPVGPAGVREELGIPPDSLVVTVVGNINPQKGHEVFLAAAGRVKEQIPSAVFLIAGHLYPNHQAYFDSLTSHAAQLNLVVGRDIHFLGPRLDIAKLMRSSDVFALASVPNSEGTPTVILEAMASGLPVVATDVGSVSEVVDDSHTGFVVPPLDPNTMANRLETLLLDEELRTAFGAAARATAEAKYSLDTYVETHLHAYDLAIRHRNRRQTEGATPQGHRKEPSMNAPAIGKALRKVDRAVELSPQFIRHPAHVREVLRGVHPGNLAALDKGWLKEIGFDVVLDVGANTGQFARAAHTVFPKARIYSFEPLPECLRAMRERMKGISGFQAFGSAIGNEDGTITIHQSASSPSSSVLPMTAEHTEAFPWTRGGTDIEVEIHTLDYFLPQLELTGNVLLKIDVQGFSQQVLLGASETLARAKAVFIETSFVQLYEGESTFDTIYRFMVDCGFEFVGFLDQLEHPRSGRILQGDAIFLRPETVS